MYDARQIAFPSIFLSFRALLLFVAPSFRCIIHLTFTFTFYHLPFTTMSGHSHYATIHRQKELKDAQKGKVFSKLAQIIAIAAKAGTDPEGNYKLRMAIEQARAANMPKANIERAISRANEVGNIEEVTYEGFGPAGIAIMIHAVTDNRNRTGQEIKNLFEREGGSLAGPGSVSFNFEQKGLIVVKKESNTEEQMLKLIDAGAQDLEETQDAIEVYTSSEKLNEVRKNLEAAGFQITSFELVQKPKNYQTTTDSSTASKVLNFLDKLHDRDDVQKVFANLDVPDEIIKKITP